MRIDDVDDMEVYSHFDGRSWSDDVIVQDYGVSTVSTSEELLLS